MSQQHWRTDLPPIWSKIAASEWNATTSEKTKNRLRQLIKSIYQDGLTSGLGKPEPLKHRPGFSRRLTQKDRLIYLVDKNKRLNILSLLGHYQ